MKPKLALKKILPASIIILALLFPTFGGFNFPKVAEAKSLSRKNYIESEVIAKIAPGTEIDALAKKYRLLATLLKTSPDGTLCVLKSTRGISTKKIIKNLQGSPAIISVQPNFQYRPLARVPNDKYFSQNWPLSDTSTVPGGVSASSAWDLETKNQTKVAIAIIDSGISYTQPDLSEAKTKGKARGRNMTNPKKKPKDTDGHGTFLAGIIAAKTNNRKGLAGSSFFAKLKIMALKIDFTTDQAISAINYARLKYVPVINASWGSYGEEGFDPLLRDAIAGYPGVFVTAAGNGDPESELGYDHDGGDPTQKMYPCDFDLPNILCVAATGSDGKITSYSDYGLASVDVAAPGGTDANPIFGLDFKKNRYVWAEGSSLSAAYASAEAGLILSKKPVLSSSQVIEIIKNSVDLDPSLTGKTVSGGKINFQKALQLSASY